MDVVRVVSVVSGGAARASEFGGMVLLDSSLESSAESMWSASPNGGIRPASARGAAQLIGGTLRGILLALPSLLQPPAFSSSLLTCHFLTTQSLLANSPM